MPTVFHGVFISAEFFDPTGSPKLIQRESVGISWQIPLFLRPLRQQMTTYPRTSVMSPVLSANASVGLPN